MKSNLDKFFKTNKELEEKGVEFAISDDVSFFVRPFKQSNPRVKAALAAHFKPFARQVELGTVDEAKQTEIQIKLFNDVCLVDWKGVELDGQSVDCTPENALKLFKSLPDLFDTLWRHANDYTNYKEDLGNS